MVPDSLKDSVFLVSGICFSFLSKIEDTLMADYKLNSAEGLVVRSRILP